MPVLHVLEVTTIRDALLLLHGNETVARDDVRRVAKRMVKLSNGTLKLSGAYSIIAKDMGYRNWHGLSKAFVVNNDTAKHWRKDKPAITTL